MEKYFWEQWFSEKEGPTNTLITYCIFCGRWPILMIFWRWLCLGGSYLSWKNWIRKTVLVKKIPDLRKLLVHPNILLNLVHLYYIKNRSDAPDKYFWFIIPSRQGSQFSSISSPLYSSTVPFSFFFGLFCIFFILDWNFVMKNIVPFWLQTVDDIQVSKFSNTFLIVGS